MDRVQGRGDILGHAPDKDIWVGCRFARPPFDSFTEDHMRFILILYDDEKGWANLSEAERQHSMGEYNKITGYMSLCKVGPKVYRARVSLAAAPNDLPEGLQSTKIKGGKYSRFVLTGPYSGLPEACGRVFEIVAKTKIGLR